MIANDLAFPGLASAEFYSKVLRAKDGSMTPRFLGALYATGPLVKLGLSPVSTFQEAIHDLNLPYAKRPEVSKERQQMISYLKGRLQMRQARVSYSPAYPSAKIVDYA